VVVGEDKKFKYLTLLMVGRREDWYWWWELPPGKKIPVAHLVPTYITKLGPCHHLVPTKDLSQPAAH
jgi:hypothetical protein